MSFLAPVRRLLPARFRKEETVVPVVRLSGVIGQVSAFRQGITLAAVAPQLQRAFTMKEAPVVAIAINSPGGSPVQSHLVFKRIRALAEEHKKEVIVVVEDVAASGGYLIALAGDRIIVDASSIVGSIGVVSAGFGFTGLIEKLGIERRVHTAGENKAMLDPFQPERESDVQHLKSLQRDVHDMFIELVRSRRGTRLSDEPTMFTGAFWSGARAVELGLVDGLGDLRSHLRERFGDKLRLALIEPKRDLMARFGGDRGGIGAAGPRSGAILAEAVDHAISAVESRALWNRYGL
ncbi:S49 family peptidase [Mesorhizobium sp. BR1-1-16]|uniref:S49 family peptidase n=1 Tax=Mesorhizobium sp. BR1-1-16 TaxID=2876653 RepID=UPI001CCD7B36|nr:S49 family peptidase [Mesorhizobium sp. BR1-1-16]MBZ9934844.1 S49 family peptidase [Mesorhizobium sp. BR1-1-16]